MEPSESEFFEYSKILIPSWVVNVMRIITTKNNEKRYADLKPFFGRMTTKQSAALSRTFRAACVREALAYSPNGDHVAACVAVAAALEAGREPTENEIDAAADCAEDTDAIAWFAAHAAYVASADGDCAAAAKAAKAAATATKAAAAKTAKTAKAADAKAAATASKAAATASADRLAEAFLSLAEGMAAIEPPASQSRRNR